MAEFQRREAAGESVWTKAFGTEARVRLQAVLDRWIGHATSVSTHKRARDVATYLRLFGVTIRARRDDLQSIRLAIAEGDDETLPSLLEACMVVIDTADFTQMVKLIFEQERLAYRVVGHDLIPFESLEMHEEVVAPTLRLLAGRPDLQAVEASYQDALKEIGSNPGNAITDAGRALQDMLTTLGCEGETIGQQLKDARMNRKLLANHDSTLSAGIEKFMEWVSRDRSEKGDAHKAAMVRPEDAWFAVHVVGALIVRLAEGPRV